MLTRSLIASVPESPPVARLDHDSELESFVLPPLFSKQHSAASIYNINITWQHGLILAVSTTQAYTAMNLMNGE
jgi:hypothetical protein